MKKAGEEIIMWFSESQLPRTLPRFGPITSAGETRFGSFSCWRYLCKKILPDFRFGRKYSFLMIVMLYQEYGNHGFGSQEGDFSSKAGQLFQGFSGRGMQAAELERKRECRGRNTSITFSCNWVFLPFKRLQRSLQNCLRSVFLAK